MFRRLFWLAVGTGLGFGASFWVMRFVREQMARYTPERVSADLAGAVGTLIETVRDAAADGRKAMGDREAELRLALEKGPETSQVGR